MPRRRIWPTVLGILIAVVASLVFAAWPGKSTFTVDTETTYVTEPLDEHGYVDYVTALNERLSKGITPNNNANVLIWQALGPHPEGGTMPPEYFHWLGIESPPEEGEYFLSWQSYRKDILKVAPGVEINLDNDPIFRAVKRPWTAKDEPELADWLKRNEKPLAVVMVATRRTEYYNPLAPRKNEDGSDGLIGALLPSVQKCRELANALACRAMLRVSEGKADEAWQDSIACHRLGRLIARGGSLIELLVGIAIEAIASHADVILLDHTKLTSKQVLAFWEDLRKLPPMPAVADKIDLGERFMVLDTFMLVARKGTASLESLSGGHAAPPKGDSFHAKLFTRSINWDPALRNANRWIDRFVTVLRITDRTERLQEMAAIDKDLRTLKQQVNEIDFVEKSLKGSVGRGEMIGNILITLMLPAFDKLQTAAERCEQGQRNLHLTFALAAYQQDNGRYPSKLDELAPKYLEKIPDDHFSGKPLIYRPEDKGYLLYSVGPNGIDDGGRSSDDDPPGDDLIVRIPVKPPKPRDEAGRAPDKADPIGLFDNHGDVGAVLHPGSVEFDKKARSYTVAGSGENMWSTKDAFHFVWKKVSGDLALMADISFLGEGTDPHRKACLMIRQSLDADAAYVDAALHGDGLTSLQFREAKGAVTHEVQSNVSAPTRLRIEKRGKYALLYLAAKDKDLSFSGAAVRLPLDGPFYVGIGVCAHNKDVTEKAVFANVDLTTSLPTSAKPPVLYSTLETQTIASTDRRVVYVTPTRIEAPNWLADGKTLIFNSGGRIHSIPLGGGKPKAIDTDFATRCNNDHGVSPDGTLLVISDQSQKDRKSLIYTLPIDGGKPKLITPSGPSYWHGWSPDGKTLAFCGEREGKFDIYTIPADGGNETRLTQAKGLNDGPEFSPDGKTIYFNSERTDRMQIWRMKPDGGDQEQVTSDEFNNWFPHPSPDGRSLVFLSYEKDVTGHPENKDVTLRLLSLKDKKINVLGRFFGGQGTINVPCWSPDGRRIAFVTYQLIP